MLVAAPSRMRLVDHRTTAVHRSDSARSARFWGVAALFAIALFLVHAAATVLLLAFAGVLFGTCLRGLAEVVSKHLRLSMRWSLVVCTIAIVAVGAGLSLAVLPRLIGQFTELADQVTAARQSVRQQLQQSEVGRWIVQQSGSISLSLSSVARAAGMLASMLGAIGSVVFVTFVTLYVAISPDVYRRGLVRLARPARRERAHEVLDVLARTLRRWLLGRMVSMIAVGVTTSLGIWALGIPLPLAMGLLAGALGFIPNIGPIISAIPALLLAATLGPAYVGYVALLYLGINLADGYVLTPLIDRRSVSSPPALVLTMQLLFGVLWGPLGIMLATPLVACGIVIVSMTYVQGKLENRPDDVPRLMDQPQRSRRDSGH